MPETPASDKASTAALLSRATRAKTLPVLLAPVAVGAALAAYRTDRFSWPLFVLTVVGAAAAQLGGNVLNDYFDQTSGVDKLSRIDRTAVPTGSGVLESGAMSGHALLGVAGALFAVALAAGIALSLARGWLVLALAALAAVIAVEYVGPPLRYGYIGHGLGEAGLFVASGVLPVVGAYYVQAEQIPAAAALASIVPGIFTLLVVFQQNFLHWRPDRAVGKWTIVAWLEPSSALLVDGGLITLAYVILVLQVAFGLFPAWSLLALVTAPLMATSWSRTFRDPMPQTYLQLLGTTLGTALITGVVLTLTLALA